MKSLRFLLFLLAIGFFGCGQNAEKMNQPITAGSQTEQAKIDQKIIVDYVKANGLKMSVTPSGIHYAIENWGAKDPGVILGSDARIVAHYHGTYLNGKVFDSSKERKKPFGFQLGTVIPGWREAIRMMGVGGKGTFIIPSYLAYGPNGYPGLIEPNKNLKFDIELLAIGG